MFNRSKRKDRIPRKRIPLCECLSPLRLWVFQSIKQASIHPLIQSFHPCMQTIWQSIHPSISQSISQSSNQLNIDLPIYSSNQLSIHPSIIQLISQSLNQLDIHRPIHAPSNQESSHPSIKKTSHSSINPINNKKRWKSKSDSWKSKSKSRKLVSDGWKAASNSRKFCETFKTVYNCFCLSNFVTFPSRHKKSEKLHKNLTCHITQLTIELKPMRLIQYIYTVQVSGSHLSTG